MARLVGELVGLRRAARAGIEVEVCFDGRPHRRVVARRGSSLAGSFAGAGADAADRQIAALVREVPEARRVLVVSSDKRLGAAVKAAGGETSEPAASSAPSSARATEPSPAAREAGIRFPRWADSR